jgi:hypothetical protein
MTIRERLAGLGLRELLPSFIHACLAIAALMLLTDRLQRVAKSATADRSWTAATGQTLRLAGLDEGPLLGIEGTPGGGITVVSDQATLTDGGAVQPVKWMAQGDSRGDYKAKVEISIVGKDGDVVLNRVGEAVTPQVQIQVKNAKLRVDVGVTVGDSLTMPKTRVVVGERDLPPAGPGFSYIVPDGDSLSVEYPEPSNDQPSGVATWLGSVREKEQDTILPLREVAIVPEDARTPDSSACAAGQRYAFALFFRPVLFPYPTGKDCKPGILTARNLQLTADTVVVSLAGKAWEMKDGMPSASLWSWASGNPVLSLVINKLLPAAVGLALGLFTWNRRASKDRGKAEKGEGEEKVEEASPRKPRRAVARDRAGRKTVRARRN